MSLEKDVYFVAVKIFLRDVAGRLFIIKDRFGDWDLPGGRLRPDDFFIPLEQVVGRKIHEELGIAVQYKLESQPTVFMRHQREEILADGTREPRRIFAIGYRAEYLGGDIDLGGNHVQSEWVDIQSFNPESYFQGGWLKGVKDYIYMIKKSGKNENVNI